MARALTAFNAWFMTANFMAVTSISNRSIVLFMRSFLYSMDDLMACKIVTWFYLDFDVPLVKHSEFLVLIYFLKPSNGLCCGLTFVSPSDGYHTLQMLEFLPLKSPNGYHSLWTSSIIIPEPFQDPRTFLGTLKNPELFLGTSFCFCFCFNKKGRINILL